MKPPYQSEYYEEVIKTQGMADFYSNIQSKCYKHCCNRDEDGLYDNNGSATEDISIGRRWTVGRHSERLDAVIRGRVSELQHQVDEKKGSRETEDTSMCEVIQTLRGDRWSLKLA